MPASDSSNQDPAEARVFRNIGPALRFLRQHGLTPAPKQKEVAARAGITKGMLSSYETGKQEPSLQTLGRLLAALDADLNRLDWALRRVGQPLGAEGGTDAGDGGGDPGPASRSPFGRGSWGSFSEVAEEEAPYGEPEPRARSGYRLVEVPEPLSGDEERALGQMLAGFYSFLRYQRDGEH